MHFLCSFVHEGTFQDEYCKLFSSGPRPSDKVGGGKAVSKKSFFFYLCSISKGREGKGRPPGPLPWIRHYCLRTLLLSFPKNKTKEKEDVKPFNINFIGRLVGGHETLNAMERVECDEKDRPKVNAYRIQFNSCLFRQNSITSDIIYSRCNS